MSEHQDKRPVTLDVDDARAIPDPMEDNRLSAGDLANLDKAFSLALTCQRSAHAGRVAESCAAGWTPEWTRNRRPP